MISSWQKGWSPRISHPVTERMAQVLTANLDRIGKEIDGPVRTLSHSSGGTFVTQMPSGFGRFRKRLRSIVRPAISM